MTALVQSARDKPGADSKAFVIFNVVISVGGNPLEKIHFWKMPSGVLWGVPRGPTRRLLYENKAQGLRNRSIGSRCPIFGRECIKIPYKTSQQHQRICKGGGVSTLLPGAAAARSGGGYIPPHRNWVHEAILSDLHEIFRVLNFVSA